MDENQNRYSIAQADYDAVIFDLDGVVTRTAKVHARAWKKLFDDFLQERARRQGGPFEPFDAGNDYRHYVDGKPRYDGVQSFLESRNIDLPFGSPEDAPGSETMCALGNRKNSFFLAELKKHGVEVYESTVKLLRELKKHSMKTAIVSSSKNCGPVIESAHVTDLFDVKVDGIDSQELQLAGKPAPDIFLKAAGRLDVDPARAVVVEDAIAGVQAGSRGAFGLVIGVDRNGNPGPYMENGADLVVGDLAEISLEPLSLPSALEHVREIVKRPGIRRCALFLDYDGTLTPIVARPEDAVLSDSMRTVLQRLAAEYPTAVISGRDLDDLKNMVSIDGLYYAGSHGFDIAGPDGTQQSPQDGVECLPILDRAEQQLLKKLEPVGGARVERKKFSIAVHYRAVEESAVARVARLVQEISRQHPELRMSRGKKIFELQPDIDWDKGKALLWFLNALDLQAPDMLPIYIGDDVTDEDAFKVLREHGAGIRVSETPGKSSARYLLRDPGQVRVFLESLIELAKESAGTDG